MDYMALMAIGGLGSTILGGAIGLIYPAFHAHYNPLSQGFQRVKEIKRERNNLIFSPKVEEYLHDELVYKQAHEKYRMLEEEEAILRSSPSFRQSEKQEGHRRKVGVAAMIAMLGGLVILGYSLPKVSKTTDEVSTHQDPPGLEQVVDTPVYPIVMELNSNQNDRRK